MDNMLYIIAGLVLILLIAGLVLRKKKAQSPAAQPNVKSEKEALTPTPKTASNATTHSPQDSDNKFDHITIAQRFMDQQRYDKAIETLNRGLVEKPKDNQLSLKLLSIYATINQPENFNKVYDSIKAQNDAESIVLADKLKTLFFEEQNSEVLQAPSIEEKSDFESIDFDLPTSQHDYQSTPADEPVVDFDKDMSINDTIDNTVLTDGFQEAEPASETIEDSFDLTLSDLENEEFVLDFDDLVSDSDKNTEAAITEELTSDANQSIDDDFILSDDFALSLDNVADSNTIESELRPETPAFESSSDIEDFVLEDNGFEDNNVEDNSLENNKVESVNLEQIFDDNMLEVEPFEETSSAPTAPLLFDDNTALDDTFTLDLDAPTAVTPVDAEPDTTTEAAKDFSSRFAEDFDFVNSLDSNQVALDLAGQYLQLGEYDSAKRLLNEVIAQGNSEQQSQAKALLERTA